MSRELTLLERIDDRLSRIETMLRHERKLIMGALENLTAQVQKNTDAEASAAATINSIAAQLADLAKQKNNDAEIQALADKLAASAVPLAAAIVANTPAASPPAPAPDPAPATPPATPASP